MFMSSFSRVFQGGFVAKAGSFHFLIIYLKDKW